MKSLVLAAYVLTTTATQSAPGVAPSPSQAVNTSQICLDLRAEAVRLAEAQGQRSETLLSAMDASQGAVQDQIDQNHAQARAGTAVSMAAGLASAVPGVGILAGLAGSVAANALAGGPGDTGAVRAAQSQVAQAQQQMIAGLPDLARMQQVAEQMQAHGC